MTRRGVACAELAEIPPGPELAAALAGLRLDAVPNDQVVDVLQAQARQLAHEQARMLATLVEVSRTVPGAGGPARTEQAYEWASGEISAALCWTGRASDRELGFAETVVTGLPLVFAALWAGRIDRARAWVFADHLDPATCGLSADQIEVICARLVPVASRLTTGELAARLLRAVIAVDPTHARRRYTRALREREVISYLDRDGTVTISAQRLDPGEAAAAVERLRVLAKAVKRAGHPGRLPQIQADLFCGLLNGRYHGYTHDQIVADLVANVDSHTPGGPGSGDRHDGGGGHGSDGEHDSDGEQGSAGHDKHGGYDRAGGGGFAGLERVGCPDIRSAQAGMDAGAGMSGRAPAPAGIEVRAGLGTLLGIDDQPGEIPGLGPILAPIARCLVTAHIRGTRWRFAVTDPEGYLVLAGAIRARPTHTRGGRSEGGIVEIHVPADLLERLSAQPADAGAWAGVVADIATQYRNRNRLLAALDHKPYDRFPCAALARHIEVRDRTCTFPGCRCSAHDCQLDHTTDRAHGGPTTSTNLGPGCTRHHPYKHQHGWRLRQPRAGCFEWRSPLGRTYRTRGQPITPPLPPPHPPRAARSGNKARPPPTPAAPELDDDPRS